MLNAEDSAILFASYALGPYCLIRAKRSRNFQYIHIYIIYREVAMAAALTMVMMETMKVLVVVELVMVAMAMVMTVVVATMAAKLISVMNMMTSTMVWLSQRLQ